MPKVTFMPDDVSIDVRAGENLLRAAMIADVQVTASCGGDGTCGKCRMIVEEGSVEAPPSAKLSKEQSEQGFVLACLAQIVEDTTVRIPPESRPGSVPVRDKTSPHVGTMLSSDEFEGRVPRARIDPPLGKKLLRMTPPDLSDSMSDGHRIRRALRREHGIANAGIDLSALRKLPSAMREDDWTVTALVLDVDPKARVLDVQPGDTTARAFAVAVDVGTTTVDAQLVDTTNGRVVAQVSEYNAQVGRGEDVITRIIVASDEEGLSDLHGLVISSIRTLVERMLRSAKVSPDEIVSYVAAGNTVMTHLLLGLSPKNIRSEPYIPAATTFPWMRADELDLPGSPATLLHALPCPASYVGGDIVGGVLAAGIPWTDKLTLFVDIGTNGEIVLGSKEWLVACSCSAGPAFEGGSILHGMRAASGAIEQVRVDPETLDPMILTIDQAKPIGICGSGLIDCVSELFLVGAIDRTGKFDPDTVNRHVREGEHGYEFVLVTAEDTATGTDIVLTEVDIGNLIRAKAAIFAGIGVLMESVDLDFDDIEQVLIAGAFGHYLELDRVMTLGLLPEIPADKFTFVGNGSLIGARLVSVSKPMLHTAEEVAEKLTYLELSVNAGFMDMYVSAMFLPHTDLSLFPGTEKRLKTSVGRS